MLRERVSELQKVWEPEPYSLRCREGQPIVRETLQTPEGPLCARWFELYSLRFS
jgi:hypothetical protein